MNTQLQRKEAARKKQDKNRVARKQDKIGGSTITGPRREPYCVAPYFSGTQKVFPLYCIRNLGRCESQRGGCHWTTLHELGPSPSPSHLALRIIWGAYWRAK